MDRGSMTRDKANKARLIFMIQLIRLLPSSSFRAKTYRFHPLAGLLSPQKGHCFSLMLIRRLQRGQISALDERFVISFHLAKRLQSSPLPENWIGVKLVGYQATDFVHGLQLLNTQAYLGRAGIFHGLFRASSTCNGTGAWMGDYPGQR